MKNISKEERLKSEREHYNKKYSEIDNLSGWRIYEKRIFGKYLERMDGKSLLEIGCGQGDVIKELYNNLEIENLKYYGIDISEEGVRKGRKNFPQGKFYQGDCNNLKYKKNSFDSALCLGVLHHLPQPYEGLKELLRVVKKGGIIMLREPSERSFKKGESPYERGLDISKLMKTIKENGGEVIKKQKINSFPIKATGHILNKLKIEKSLPNFYWDMKISTDIAINKIIKKSFLSGVDYMLVIKKVK